MRVLLDYRPALRERTGVGEYVHELARALAAEPAGDELVLFTSSWKDRPAPELAREVPGTRIVDRRVPVRALTWAWNRLEWPAIESLAGPVDVVHGQTPLLVPARDAAQVVTVHDLDFLHHPERATAEMRRDFPALARAHAHRAHAIVVSSHYAAGEVTRHLDVAPDRVHVCPPGAPGWAAAVADARPGPGRYLLFVGTLQPRKNVPGLLEAYKVLVARKPDAPPLVVAGQATPAAEAWMAATREPPLAGRVEWRGYIREADRPALYRDARALVLPSHEEGFGLPVLEAMACGVPVIVSTRGALPEVAGEAADPVDPQDVEGLAARMAVLLDEAAAADAAGRGRRQAMRYSWSACAAAARAAYRAAVARRVRATS